MSSRRLSYYQSRPLEQIHIGFVAQAPGVSPCFSRHWRRPDALTRCKKPGFLVGPSFRPRPSPWGNIIASCIEIEITAQLCGLMRLNCSLEMSAETSFGLRSDNGTFSGLVGQVLDGTFDMSAPQLTPTDERLKVLDPSKIVLLEPLIHVTRIADKSGFKFSSIYAFDKNMWLLILASLVIVSALSLLLNVASKQNLQLLSTRAGLRRYFFNVLDATSMFLQQGPTEEYSSPAMLLLGWWGLTTVVLASVYSSFILATSLDQSFDFPFAQRDPDSLAKCIREHRCEMGFTEKAGYYALSVEANNSLSQVILESDVLFSTDIINMILLSKKYIISPMAPSEFVGIMGQNERCSLMAMATHIDSPNVFFFPKNMFMRHDFDVYITMMQSIGLINKILDSYLGTFMRDQNKCFNVDVENIPMSLGSYIGATIPLAAGILLGLLSFLLERMKKRTNVCHKGSKM